METIKIAFLVLPEIHLMDLSGPEEVFYEAIDFGADLKVEYCSITDQLKTSGGLPIGKLPRFSDVNLKKGDYLFVPGAPVRYVMSPGFASQRSLFKWINHCAEQGVNVCSVCCGAFILAQAGTLDNKNCTTHFQRSDELKRLFPKLRVAENVLFVQDGNIYSSAGIAAGIDMALFILEQIKGPYFAHKIARELVIYMRRSGAYSQKSIFVEYRNHIHCGVHQAQDYITENINKKTSVAQLARIACMSERNFTRIFKKEAGVTVNEYTTLVRKERIKELLKNPDLTRYQIAKEVGLKSDRQLNRLVHAL